MYNLSISTLHYYEKEGMIPTIVKNESGIRLYDDKDLEWIKLICCLRQTGMSVKEIRNYVQLCNEGKDTVLERLDIIRKQKQEIENKIRALNENYKIICEKETYYLQNIKEDKDAINPASI